MFYTTSVGAVGLIPFLFFIDYGGSGGGAASADVLTWGLFLLVGMVFGTGGHLFNVLALHYAGPVRVAPFFYMSIIWSIMAQTLIFGGGINALGLAGAGIIIASGMFVLWRETRIRQHDGDR